MDIQMPDFVYIFPPHGRDIKQQPFSTLRDLGVLAREKLVPLAEQQRRKKQRETEQEERCKETQETSTGDSRIE
jgi:16S rRNA G966 N2-methylase RsmD